jgi:hypothetical protein
MTEFIDTARLHQLSAIHQQLAPPMGRLVPVMRWAIDQATGRPVANWELAPRPLLCSLRAEP